MIFKNNTATSFGGAIYAKECDTFHMGGRHCSIRHTNSSLHPNSWETNFTFINNKLVSGKPNSIFVNSIYPCIWSNSQPFVTESHNVFCWREWSYENRSRSEDCLQQLKSDPVNISTTGDIILFPGKSANLGVTVFDGCVH